MTDAPCPCGSGRTFDRCCEALVDGRAQAPTAERLMRSRYTAYALGRADHVFRTWHPRTRPDVVEPLPELRWTGLTVQVVTDGGPQDDEGTVEFEAAFVGPTGPGVLRERSRFVRRRGRWVYVDGV